MPPELPDSSAPLPPEPTVRKRTLATWLCLVPILFSAQCIFFAANTPVFKAMFADFGAPLPLPTQIALAHGPWSIAISVIIPLTAFFFAREGNARTAVPITLLLGLLMFLFAQLVTIALFLPIYQLGTVAGVR